MAKFFFNHKGVDFNGNPDWADENDGWVIINAQSFDDAITQLPAATQELIKSEMKKERASSFTELIEITAGWGLPFTFYNEDDFEAYLDSML